MAEKRAAKKATKTANPAAKKTDDEAAVLAKIAVMPAPYRAMGERLHTLILRSAPALQPTLWYGMPGYAKDGRTVCFFRADKKYMTFGFTQEANLTRDERAPHQLIESAWYFTAAGRRDRGQALRHRAQGREVRACRLYQLKPEPLQEVDARLAPFRRCWSAHVDALERHLDRMDQSTPTKRKTRRRRRGPNREREKGDGMN
jgi:hypothetical protein